jgi:hypothetical protein
MVSALAAASKALAAAAAAVITVAAAAAALAPLASPCLTAAWAVVAAADHRMSRSALRTSRTAKERRAQVTARSLFIGITAK